MEPIRFSSAEHEAFYHDMLNRCENQDCYHPAYGAETRLADRRQYPFVPAGHEPVEWICGKRKGKDVYPLYTL